ncbi:Low-density lipoprotein receptor-related protein [Chionoecetes opilio]|uniref:Low-density lipoprotein receptor-related protein n=1 Tax=Chionoecetes opilio TaxID=41210 RepID=A0A8J4YFE6_CHIOP|nr:Low-density lipoprotein receptor-related protein [Chionoecetes opilio]
MSLTCSVDFEGDEKTNPEIDWVIPTNSEERVQLVESAHTLRVAISDLTETDSGNYTCSLKPEPNTVIKASVTVVVLARGQMSHCSPNKFSCGSGSCIAMRYKCDGTADCLDGWDESQTHCGLDTCAGKLACDDGRCLSHKLCCRERDLTPPNCTIMATIQCCRQLVHPALLDPDLYYMDYKQSLQQHRNQQPDSTLVMGCIVAVANLVTVAIIVGVRYHLWRSNGLSARPHYRLSRLRSATLRPFGWGSSLSPPSTTDQYQLRTADTLYSRRIPSLRSDLLAPEIVQEQRQQFSRQQRQFSGGVVLCPPSHHSQPPQYSQLPNTPQGPPPAYHQVVGAPPPPYCSRDDLNQGGFGDNSPLAILTPLLPSNFQINNNGDINGNNTPLLTMVHNHNADSAAAAAASTSHHAAAQARNK